MARQGNSRILRRLHGHGGTLADLADAEAALLRWEHSSAPVKEARVAEYRDLVRDLAAELEATLDRHL